MTGWYQAFNLLEAVLWGVVSGVVWIRTPAKTWQQRLGIWLAVISFLTFGITDVLEAGHERSIPLWLWGLKILCGIGLFSSRYIWKGWDRFHWTDREFLFALGCLMACLGVISLQYLSMGIS